jgi:hypothetical protein
MTSDFESARDDLAFLRGLVGEPGESAQTRALGEGYFAGGLIYGGQMLLHAGQGLGLLPQAGLGALAIGLGPTILFVPIISWIIVRNRRNEAKAGLVARAIGRMFGIVGLANLVLIAIIGTIAWRHRSLDIWLIYPCMVFVLQAMAWQFAWMMRRRAWHGLVAFGWYASALAMGLTVSTPTWYILFAGLGLWFCMALPGYLMVRTQRAGG